MITKTDYLIIGLVNVILFFGLQLQPAYAQGPTRDHFPAETIESEVNTCTVIATTTTGPLLEAIVCDSTIPNYKVDCETYEGRCLIGTINKINEYLELRGLTTSSTDTATGNEEEEDGASNDDEDNE